MQGQPVRVPVQPTDKCIWGVIFFRWAGVWLRLSTHLRFSMLNASLLFNPEGKYFY